MQIKVKDKVYFARIIYSTGIYEVCELNIRTAQDNWFVGIDTSKKSDKHAYLFYESDIGKTIFFTRKEAVEKVDLEQEKKPKRKLTLEEE